MDRFLSKTQKKAISDIMINDIITPRVKEIRESLAKDYDINDGCFKDYNGLCNTASDEFCNNMADYFKKHKDLADEMLCSVGIIHGEQKHSSEIKSSYWPIQHTWCYVKFARMIAYVDITSQQFKNIYNDIPDYYISLDKPRWFYPDKENPAFRGFTRWINKHIKIKHDIKDNDGKVIKTVKEGLIEFIQYEIWSKISDKIYEKNKMNV